MQPTYQSDLVTLYCGDCFALLPALRPLECIVTDPPYGIGERMQGGTWGAKQKYADFREWDIALTDEQLKVVLDSASIVVLWGGNHYRLDPSRGWLVWDKVNAVATMADVEMAWTNMDRPAKRFRGPVGVHRFGHPSEKPEPLMRWSIGQTGASKICDPFMGSGTTGVAAMQLGLPFVGIESNPNYYAVAEQRIRQAEQDARLFEGVTSAPAMQPVPLF